MVQFTSLLAFFIMTYIDSKPKSLGPFTSSNPCQTQPLACPKDKCYVNGKLYWCNILLISEWYDLIKWYFFWFLSYLFSFFFSFWKFKYAVYYPSSTFLYLFSSHFLFQNSVIKYFLWNFIDSQIFYVLILLFIVAH